MGAQWMDLWRTAAQIDYIIAKATSPSEALHWLGVDDNLELLRRRLASQVYMDRTHDKTEAAAMLAV